MTALLKKAGLGNGYFLFLNDTETYDGLGSIYELYTAKLENNKYQRFKAEIFTVGCYNLACERFYNMVEQSRYGTILIDNDME